MLAIVKDKKGPGYVFKEVEIPKIKDDEVLIRVKAVGICGTDVPILKGIREVPIPLIPGHEFAGDIVEVGSKVKGFKVGDRVTPAIVIGCGHCYYCRNGMETLCDNIIETGIHVDGAFAEYVKVPEKVVHKLPENMTYEQGASIDPIASAYHPVKKASIGSEDIVVVFGPGPIGLYATQIARAEGAKKIITVGIKGDEERLKLAKKLGADETIISDENLLANINKLTDGRMADVVIEATGHPSVFEMALSSVRKHGTVIMIGIFHAPATANIAQIVRREIQIKGSICYSWTDYKECIDLVESGKVKIEPMISHTFDLKDMDKALEVIDQRKAIKIILHP
ncbi:alcohol dehydrogenase catalytic domain-containing protein [Proteiniborus sp. MB09-C3]|uniref:zinc-dependent alcohol dehydrogenase n=1 Tax=Proteiniborus sp. MB09-C3 TaxID=3050072 RepID=UPI0025574665|nr:alcohol dehydrogenase catalytic domain-containing protein [Proteiniborus sp. MB09-C3]WIV13060.1 alcohol dehydrogenase catalytic domain-containing protein [Proteiniborus sp. MB09-C3]